MLDNVDPDETAALLDRLDMERTLVNVISKSGTTGESMAGYLVVRQRLEAIVGARAVKEHLVFTTDPAGGTLRQIGQALGVPMFDLPAGVGGRFSVLSPVGLLPAALTGMDVPGLLAGRARHGRVDRATRRGGTTRPAPSPESSTWRTWSSDDGSA